MSIKFAADTAQLSEAYETIYRDLSDRAAHPSLNSLLRHIEIDNQGNAVALRFGPQAKDLRHGILAMTTALFYGIVGMSSAFPQDASRVEINACWEIHKTLVDEAERSYGAPMATFEP